MIIKQKNTSSLEFHPIKICDSHNDFLTELSLVEIPKYVEKCKKDEVEIICASYWSTEKKEDEIPRDLKTRAKMLSPTRSGYLLHIEDLWWVKDEDKLRELLKLKPFSCSLTWNYKNALASGSKAEGGLTEFGKSCVSALTRAGVTIDTAHLNRQSFYELTKICPKNIYCSHTGFYGVKRHKRNLTDKQIDLIVKSNGFIGLFFFDDCIKAKQGGAFNILDIVENLKYFTSRWGVDNIGIGSDFYGIDRYPVGLKNYAEFRNLKIELIKAGYTECEVEKIMHKNFLDFLRRVKK